MAGIWGMLKYIIIEEDSAEIAEFGIAVRINGKIRASAPCLSESRAEMEKLAALLNGLEIEPCHFDDIIEDYLTDFTV